MSRLGLITLGDAFVILVGMEIFLIGFEAKSLRLGKSSLGDGLAL
jgi:tmRNA-binding protein